MPKSKNKSKRGKRIGFYQKQGKNDIPSGKKKKGIYNPK